MTVKAHERMKTVAASSRKRLATRKDAPVVREPGRGSLAKALAAGEPQHRAKALEKLRKDEFAKPGPRESRWRTWCRMHRNWLGDQLVLPLTMESISAVTAQLKEGHDSSAAD